MKCVYLLITFLGIGCIYALPEPALLGLGDGGLLDVLLDKVGGTLEDILSTVVDVLDAADAGGLLGKLGTLLETILNSLANLLQNTSTNVNKLLGSVWTILTKLLSDIDTLISDSFANIDKLIKNLLTQIAESEDKGTVAGVDVSICIKPVQDILTVLTPSILNSCINLNTLGGLLGQLNILTLPSNIIDAFGSGQDLITFLAANVGGIIGSLDGILQIITELAQQILLDVTGCIDELIGDLETILTSLSVNLNRCVENLLT